jgi:hypothetical protein
MSAMIAPLIGVAMMYALWLFYLAVMALKHARDAGRLNDTARRLGLPILWAGYALDFIVNVLVVSVILLEFPREWLVTSRMSRHIKTGGWRGQMAQWFCDTLLDPFDPGHCK